MRGGVNLQTQRPFSQCCMLLGQRDTQPIYIKSAFIPEQKARPQSSMTTTTRRTADKHTRLIAMHVIAIATDETPHIKPRIANYDKQRPITKDLTRDVLKLNKGRVWGTYNMHNNTGQNNTLILQIMPNTQARRRRRSHHSHSQSTHHD